MSSVLAGVLCGFAGTWLLLLCLALIRLENVLREVRELTKARAAPVVAPQGGVQQIGTARAKDEIPPPLTPPQ